MVQLFPHHPILLSLWLGDKDNFMSKDEWISQYNKAMASQNTSFMNIVANRLLESGYEIEADSIIQQIFYLTEDVMKKNPDSVSDRFNLIMMCQ